MVDNKTAHLALPLPDLSNMQDEDVPRIGRAMSMLDAHAQKVDSALESQGREVAELKAGSQAQAGSLELLARALETEKAERSEADEAASIKLQELATGQNDIGQRVDTLGETSTDHETRLDAAEHGITAISTTLIGSVLSITAAEGYVPNGTVPADAAEYTREQFREFYDTYLVGGKLLTCTYAAFAAQVALTGNCAKFAIDTTAQKFKVPLLKNGDSITEAASAAELGKSYKAGLPNITGSTMGFQAITGAYGAGALYSTGSGGIGFGQSSGGGWNSIGLDANRSNPTYRNDVSTVITEQVRLRHFVVLASAQNSASVFDWSNYMAGLAGKANLDMDNLTAAGSAKVANYAMPSQRVVAVAVPASTAYTAPAPAPGWFKFVGTSSAINQYLRLSTNNFVLDELSWSSAAGQVLSLIIPARKGDAARVEYTAPTNLYLSFVFAEGGN